MSVRYIFDRATGTESIECLSSDTKPSSANGTALVEINTGARYYRQDGVWVPVGTIVEGQRTDFVNSFLTMGG